MHPLQTLWRQGLCWLYCIKAQSLEWREVCMVAKEAKLLPLIMKSLRETKAKHTSWYRTKRGADLLTPRTRNIVFIQNSRAPPPTMPPATLTQIQLKWNNVIKAKWVGSQSYGCDSFNFYFLLPVWSLILTFTLDTQYNFPSDCFPFRDHRDPILMSKRRKKVSRMVLTRQGGLGQQRAPDLRSAPPRCHRACPCWCPYSISVLISDMGTGNQTTITGLLREISERIHIKCL